MSTSRRAIQRIQSQSLPDYTAIGSGLYKRIDKGTLFGLYLDSSGFSKDVRYPTVFWVPLYTKLDHLHFNFGTRLETNNSKRFNFSEENLEAVTRSLDKPIRDWFNRVSNPMNRELDLKARARSSKDLHAIQAWIFLLAFEERDDEINSIASWFRTLRWTKPWQTQIASEIEDLIMKLSDGASLHQLFEANINHSCKALGIEPSYPT